MIPQLSAAPAAADGQRRSPLRLATRGRRSRARKSLACPLLSTAHGTEEKAIMAWILIRTFIITPVIFLIAAPVLLAIGLYAAFESDSLVSSPPARCCRRVIPRLSG